MNKLYSYAPACTGDANVNVAPLIPAISITFIPSVVCAPADVPSGLTVTVVVPNVFPSTTKLSVVDESFPRTVSILYVLPDTPV